MKVTDLDYYLEKPKVAVLDFLCNRVFGRNKFQNVIITDGKEGYGKSTLVSGDAYYMAYKMRRELALFFDLNALKDFAVKNKDKIIIWDDAALSGLSMESYNSSIIELIKILLLARKKRHTYFINIQDIYFLKKPIVERAISWNHVYSPDDISLGHYCYYNQKQLGNRYNFYLTKRRKTYKPFSFRGGFPKILYKVFDEQAYEFLKDNAILSIRNKLTDKEGRYKKALRDLRNKVASIDEFSTQTKARLLDTTTRSIQRWKKDKNPKVFTPTSDKIKSIGLYINPVKQNYLSLPSPKKLDILELGKTKTLEKEMIAY